MLQCYIDKKFQTESLSLIEKINDIIDDYRAEGFVLTVRQLYYQLVARAIIPNTLKDYKRIASLVNDAKLAGMIDWDMLEDRTRSFITRSRWNSPSEILTTCARSYHQDMWFDQDTRVFVIIEKEALTGVLEDVCHEYDVPLLAARGYPSGSVLREFALKDLYPTIGAGIGTVVLHLGDHDPSGIDMTRDLEERLALFTEEPLFKVTRIALTMGQIEEQQPPENPAKTTDSRFADYQRRYGESSWELDALSPTYLSRLVEKHINKYIDPDIWKRTKDEIEDKRLKLQQVADDFRKQDL
jgi:hypothetical protein